MCGWQWTTRAREYRFPRIERTESCSSSRQFLRLRTRAPWQLISRVGAISDDGLSGLLSFTNIFTGMRCSFRLRSGVCSTSSPLGRGVQHHHPTAKAFRRNGTKGQWRASDPVLHWLQRSGLFAVPAATFRGGLRSTDDRLVARKLGQATQAVPASLPFQSGHADCPGD